MARDISLSYEDGSTLYGADAVLQQYEIAMFTVPTEFSPDGTFGLGLERFLGEANNYITAKAIKQRIISFTRDRFPEIGITHILITQTKDNQIDIELEIIIIPYGQRRTLKKNVSAS